MALSRVLGADCKEKGSPLKENGESWSIKKEKAVICMSGVEHHFYRKKCREGHGGKKRGYQLAR